MRAGRPRVKIRPPKAVSKLDIEEVWSQLLRPAMYHILRRNPSTLKFEQLYDACYKLVVQQQGQELYKRYSEDLTDFVKTTIMPKIVNCPDDDLIQQIGITWREYSEALVRIAEVMMYLNRALRNDIGKPSLQLVGELIFRDLIVTTHSQKLFSQIVIALNLERENVPVDCPAIKEVIGMVSSLPYSIPGGDSVFSRVLEPLLLESTKTYAARLKNLIQVDYDAAMLIRRFAQWLAAERQRGLMYLPGNQDGFLEIIREIIAQVLPQVLSSSSGVRKWLDQPETMKLAAQVYADVFVASHEQKEDLVEVLVAQCLKADQASINIEAEQEVSEIGKGAAAIHWVVKSLGLRTKYSEIAVNVAPTQLAELRQRLNKARAEAQNEFANAPEFLALYVNELLKKGGRTFAGSSEDALDGAAKLFESLADKDEFSAHYLRHLARRLLNKRSQNEDFEHAFIYKMRRVTTPGFVSKFEMMFHDLELSAELNQSFRSRHSEIIPTNVTVLRLSQWPSSVTTEHTLALPPELDAARQSYTDMYLDQHPSRKLQWNHAMSSADINLHINGKRYLVILPVYALAVVLQFPGNERWTASEISERTKVPFQELVKYLQGLLSPRTQLLCKEPPDSAVAMNDVFYFNQNFASSIPRVRVLPVTATPSQTLRAEEAAAAKELDNERAFVVRAAIVRVMKSRRELSHALLVQQVASQLSRRFRVKPAMVKKEINALIEIDYLKRASDPSIYEYVA